MKITSPKLTLKKEEEEKKKHSGMNGGGDHMSHRVAFHEGWFFNNPPLFKKIHCLVQELTGLSYDFSAYSVLVHWYGSAWTF